MSGHSKWATIKRAKGAADAKRGKIFSVISKDITLAARDGGGDPAMNPRLRTVIAIVEITTDNKNRSASEVRSTMTKNGGNLAGVGSVAFQFDRKGQVIVDSEKIGEEALMDLALEAGAEDIKNEGDHFEVICPMTEYDTLSQALEEKEIETESSDLAYLPNIMVPVGDIETARKVLHLIEKLDDLEDVKAVHSNMDIAEDE